MVFGNWTISAPELSSHAAAPMHIRNMNGSYSNFGAAAGACRLCGQARAEARIYAGTRWARA